MAENDGRDKAISEMIASGIEGLDQRLGGLRRRGSFLLSGGHDTGKSIFTLQFLRAGLEREERAVLLTSGRPRDFLRLAAELELPVEHWLQSEELVVLRQVSDTPEIISGDQSLAEMIEALANLLLPVEASRLAIDSAVPLVQMFHPDYLEKGLLTFLGEMRQLGLTVLLTTLMPASRRTLGIRNFLEEKITGSIHLDEHTREDGTVNRKMVVRRMKGLEPPLPVFHCRLEPGRGLVITTESETGLETPRRPRAPEPAAAAERKGISFTSTYQVPDQAAKPPPPPKPDRADAAPRISFRQDYRTGEEAATGKHPAATPVPGGVSFPAEQPDEGGKAAGGDAPSPKKGVSFQVDRPEKTGTDNAGTPKKSVSFQVGQDKEDGRGA